MTHARDTEESHTESAARPRKVALFAAVAVLILAADIITKTIVVATISETAEPRRVLAGLVYLQQTRNSGAAFSLGTGATVILTAIAVIVVVVIMRVARSLRSTGWAVAFGLILGGALGNLTDRVFRAPGFGRGHVVDWISLFGPNARYWPIFNVADSAIVCGAVLAGLLAVLGIDFDGSRGRRTEQRRSGDGGE